MSIFADRATRLVVQGITGRDGSFHTRQMVEYGTNVVAGVTPGKGGLRFDDKVPVYNTVAEAVRETGANASVIYVPPVGAAGAMYEAAEAGVRLIVCITEGVPVMDMTRVLPFVRARGARLIGPNCPGLITPGEAKVGIIPGNICAPGRVGIGGDPLIGTNFIDVLRAFQDDPDTDVIVLMGEIGGTDEQMAAEFVRQSVTKPVIGFIAGQTAPKGRRMGHAGAIISGSSGTAEEKIAAFEGAGFGIMKRPLDVVELVKARL